MIVFDSSTLILLAKAELLDAFLGDYKGTVLIPKEVKAESCLRKNSFDAMLIRKMIEDGRIGVAKISDARLCANLMDDFRLCKGEGEAIALAIEKKAKLLATDDRNAIRACKMLRLPFTSAVAIAVRMAGKGIMDSARAEAALEALFKYGRYGREVIKEARERLKG